MHSPVKESILYPRASHHSLRCGRGQLNYPHPLWPIASDMGLDSITQTLSNPDCGLSKPHIPDNTPYISHRLIHSNRQGPHPQIYHMTCLSFSLTMATICLPLPYYSHLYFSHFLQCLSSFFHLLFPIYSVCTLLISTISVHSKLLSSSPPLHCRSSTTHRFPFHCTEIANYRGRVIITGCFPWKGLFSPLYVSSHPHLQYTQTFQTMSFSSLFGNQTLILLGTNKNVSIA